MTRRPLLLLTVALVALTVGCLQEMAREALGPIVDEADYVATLAPSLETARQETRDAEEVLRNVRAGTATREEGLQALDDARQALQAAKTDLLATEVPDRFVATHRHLTNGFEFALDSIDAAERCLDRMRPTECDRAVDLRREGLAELREAEAALPEEWRHLARLAREGR